jgi:hypothetical protein
VDGVVFFFNGLFDSFNISQCIFRDIRLSLSGPTMISSVIYIDGVENSKNIHFLNTTISTGGFVGIYLGGNSKAVNLTHVYFERNNPDLRVVSLDCFDEISTINTYTVSFSEQKKLVCGNDGSESDESFLFLPLTDGYELVWWCSCFVSFVGKL